MCQISKLREDLNKIELEGRGMVQAYKFLEIKSDSLGPITGNHTVRGKELTPMLPSDPYTSTKVHTHRDMHLSTKLRLKTNPSAHVR